MLVSQPSPKPVLSRQCLPWLGYISLAVGAHVVELHLGGPHSACSRCLCISSSICGNAAPEGSSFGLLMVLKLCRCPLLPAPDGSSFGLVQVQQQRGVLAVLTLGVLTRPAPGDAQGHILLRCDSQLLRRGPARTPSWCSTASVLFLLLPQVGEQPQRPFCITRSTSPPKPVRAASQSVLQLLLEVLHWLLTSSLAMPAPAGDVTTCLSKQQASSTLWQQCKSAGHTRPHTHRLRPTKAPSSTQSGCFRRYARATARAAAVFNAAGCSHSGPPSDGFSE
jgi:hypothetical protein